MRVPENYSGNAFSPVSDNEKEEEKLQNEEANVNIDSSLSDDEAIPIAATDKSRQPAFKFDLGRFFPTNRSFGMEEFLIIALILLLAQNDTDDDTLIFLILLLFIK
jgi:hypothetical protein